MDARVVIWRGAAGASGALAGMAARWLVLQGWRAGGQGDEAPDPADRSNSWRAVIGWGIASGVGMGVARVVARRVTAEAWERALDEPAPTAAANA